MSQTAAHGARETSWPAFAPGTRTSTVAAGSVLSNVVGGGVQTVVDRLVVLHPAGDVAVLHPADANETVECWRIALRRGADRTVLVLSRREAVTLGPPPLDVITRTGHRVARDDVDAPEAILLASGPAVPTALAGACALAERGYASRVLSVPWPERFAGEEECGIPQVWVDMVSTVPEIVSTVVSRLRD